MSEMFPPIPPSSPIELLFFVLIMAWVLTVLFEILIILRRWRPIDP